MAREELYLIRKFHNALILENVPAVGKNSTHDEILDAVQEWINEQAGYLQIGVLDAALTDSGTDLHLEAAPLADVAIGDLLLIDAERVKVSALDPDSSAATFDYTVTRGDGTTVAAAHLDAAAVFHYTDGRYVLESVDVVDTHVIVTMKKS